MQALCMKEIKVVACLGEARRYPPNALGRAPPDHGVLVSQALQQRA